MRIDLTSLMFNMSIDDGGGTPSWGTAMGQRVDHKYTVDGHEKLLVGMVYKKILDTSKVYCPLGKGGSQQSNYEYTLASLFDKVFVNGKHVEGARFVLLIVTQLIADATQHIGRKQLKYSPKITLDGNNYNDDCYKKMASAIGLNDDSAWFVTDISVENQDELHFTAVIADKDKGRSFVDSNKRKEFCAGLAHISRALGGYNKIYYGAPGCGKSYHVKYEILGSIPVNEDNQFRTTFHPDYSNTDFVGQIMPVVEMVEDSTKPGKLVERVSYKFNPGPFALALKRCHETDKMVYLVIEEINRGNASAIFGDLFQLLDRIRDTSKPNWGESEYHITHVGLQKFLKEELGQSFENIVIPSNLTILATMNSSDQNVFTLDTAFKRRWAFEQISNDIDADTKHPYKGWFVPGTGITWATFLKKINAVILDFKITNASNEDKRLGKYFVTKDCLTETAMAPGTCDVETNNFAYKVLEYLWNDVCKFNRDEMFDEQANKTLEDLIESFRKQGLAIFQKIDFEA